MEYVVVKNRRQQIVEEAGFLFRKKGFKATSMKDIAEQVKMEAASLYNHIKSKDEILSELLLHIAHKFEHGMKNINGSSYSPFDKIKALMALHIRLTTENTHAIGLLTQDWKHLKEPHSQQFMTIRKKYSEDFLNIIKEGMDKGELKKANPEITLNSILSSVRWLYDWYTEDKGISPVELEIQITDLLVNGFKAR
jgi:AcrR family transcriptional regulator